MTIAKVNGVTWAALAKAGGIAKAALSKVNGIAVPPSVTRLYLSNAAAGYDPATERGSWTTTTGYTSRKLGAKSGAAATKAGSRTTTGSTLLLKYVTDGLPANVTISGTMQIMIGADLNTTGFLATYGRIYAFVTQGDSDNVRGTLLTGTNFPNVVQATPQGYNSGAIALTNVDAQTGDRIVIELGGQYTMGGSASVTLTYNYGNTGATDLTEGSTNVTTEPGWIEFGTNLGL